VGPQNQNDPIKSLTVGLAGILFVLVLLDKSMSPGRISLPDPGELKRIPKEYQFNPDQIKDPAAWKPSWLEFRNLGKQPDSRDFEEMEIPVVSDPNMEPQKTWEFQEKEALQNLDSIPDEEVPSIGESKNLNPGYVNIYFIKFFGKDNKAESRLVKVPRSLPSGSDPILFVLDELRKGPSESEKAKGVLNALPSQFLSTRSYKIENGIIILDLDPSFEFGSGPQILQDRLDQISHSLVGLGNVRGIRFRVNQKFVSSLGGDGVPVPPVLGKRERKITSL
jgi:hypothetical protein